MSIGIKNDLYKYKQQPYFEKCSKKERTLISRALRHLAKIKIT
ncbi:hypothetical protein [Clostridium estertheticum]|nr:hypothetical protein [Clostridium estertheticum]